MTEKSRTKPGNGSSYRGRHQRRILLSFDDDTFNEIRGYALKNKKSFSGAVRELVEFGLLDVAA